MFHTLTINQIAQEAAGAVAITFDVPDHLQGNPAPAHQRRGTAPQLFHLQPAQCHEPG